MKKSKKENKWLGLSEYNIVLTNTYKLEFQKEKRKMERIWKDMDIEKDLKSWIFSSNFIKTVNPQIQEDQCRQTNTHINQSNLWKLEEN
jgi:hypothetical protein